MIRTYMLIFILIAFVFSGACKQSPPPPQTQAVKASPSAPPTSIEATVAEPKVEEEIYLYDKTGKRDPFVSLIKKEEVVPGDTPLESYDVSAVRILGIVWNQKGHFAEVILPDGKAYTVKEGMPIGVHKGKVQRITKSSIIVKENVKDYKGEIKSKETILKLREEEEE